MTKGEIKRALKMCADGCFRICCPYGAGIDCCGKLKRDALDLITEQEKEIDRLKADYANLQEQFAAYQIASDKEIRAQVKQSKIDILNFLKDGYEEDISTSNDCEMVVRVDDIDELIKEVENEQKD